MKKYLLSGLVIFSFLIYSAHRQLEGNAAVGNISVPSAPAPLSDPGTLPAGTSYKDGQYLGSVADAFYGHVQVRVTVSGGKITNIKFLDYPRDRRTSVEINSQAMPILTSEAISAQSSKVDTVTGATATSQAFVQSLSSALTQAL